MSLATQMRRLQSKSAAMRQGMFGENADETPVTADYNSGQLPALPGYYSPVRNRQFTDNFGGFLEMRASVYRVIKAEVPNFIPAIDDRLTIKEGEIEILFRVDEILGTHPLSAEWVLICKEQN
jgi:hypothetical protein